MELDDVGTCTLVVGVTAAILVGSAAMLVVRTAAVGVIGPGRGNCNYNSMWD